jgi:hypothetical protein
MKEAKARTPDLKLYGPLPVRRSDAPGTHRRTRAHNGARTDLHSNGFARAPLAHTCTRRDARTESLTCRASLGLAGLARPFGVELTEGFESVQRSSAHRKLHRRVAAGREARAWLSDRLRRS